MGCLVMVPKERQTQHLKESEQPTWDEGQAGSSSGISLMISAVSALHAVCEGPNSYHLLKWSLVCSMQILCSTCACYFGGYSDKLLFISKPHRLNATPGPAE